MGLAFHSFHDVHGQLPPAAVHGDDGLPLLSWRVLMLPFIEQKELYDQFHLDEPWDSPHNITLLPKMPVTYALAPRKQARLPDFHTICHVFVGTGTAFEGVKGLRFKDDFPDGTSNTILLVEAGDPVPWTKPQELVFNPAGPLPDLASVFTMGFRVTLADGSRRWIDSKVSERTLRAAITRNGGESLGNDW